MKKWFRIILFFGLMLSLAIATQAFVVFDPTNYLQNLKTALSTVQMLINQAKQLQNDLLNLTRLDSNLANTNLAAVQQSLSQLISLNQSVKGLALDYQQMQKAWDSTYKDFGFFNGLGGNDYAKYVGGLLNQTNNSIYDAMRAQGLVAQIGDDATNLQNLMNASQSAPGALAAAQTGNQIASIQAQQLIRMQTIMATSYRAESTYYAEVVQKQAAAQANAERLKLKEKNTLKEAPQGDGFKHF